MVSQSIKRREAVLFCHNIFLKIILRLFVRVISPEKQSHIRYIGLYLLFNLARIFIFSVKRIYMQTPSWPFSS